MTWGWGAADAAIALGVTPVAIPTQSYGGDENGVLPWIGEDARGPGRGDCRRCSARPRSRRTRRSIEAKPDLILAQYSGITEDAVREARRRSRPTVAYPDEPWSTPWRDVITIAGEALGKEAEAEQAARRHRRASVAEAGRGAPGVPGQDDRRGRRRPSAFYVYTRGRPARGVPRGPRLRGGAQRRASSTPGSRRSTTRSATRRPTSSPPTCCCPTTTPRSRSRRFADRRLHADDAAVQGRHHRQRRRAPNVVASVSPPTALSLTYSLDDFVEALAGATANVK